MASYTVIVVEDAEAHEDAAEAVAQPLCLVMLVRPNLVENEGEGVRGGEEERNSLGAAGNPGAQELEQAKSEQKRNIFGKCNLGSMQFTMELALRE